jgi:hypothetical protein
VAKEEPAINVPGIRGLENPFLAASSAGTPMSTTFLEKFCVGLTPVIGGVVVVTEIMFQNSFSAANDAGKK